MSTIQVKSGIVMWHVVLCCDGEARPVRVDITQNPLQFTGHMAQVVMYKSRSEGCALQVARYVRRTHGIHEAVLVQRSNRPVEAMIGYVCMGGFQHAPTPNTPGYATMIHISGSRIRDLLAEVRGGDNAARSRYVVYEVKSRYAPPLRSVTNKLHSVERVWREAPADTLTQPDVLVRGRYANYDEAKAQCEGFGPVSPELWTRRPPAAYMHNILREEGDDVIFRFTNESAVRRYAAPTVVIGPHSYTLSHVRHVLRTGEWYDGYIRAASGPQEMLHEIE